MSEVGKVLYTAKTRTTGGRDMARPAVRMAAWT